MEPWEPSTNNKTPIRMEMWLKKKKEILIHSRK